MDAELKAAIEKIQGELAGFIAKFNEEKKTLGAGTQETAEMIRTLVKRVDELELAQTRPPAPAQNKSGFDGMLDQMKADRDFQQIIAMKKGRARLEFADSTLDAIVQRKNITEAGVGFSTPGVMGYEREPGIVYATRPRLTMREVLATRPTTQAMIAWVAESYRPTKASPVTEATETKPLSDVTFTTYYESVRTIALCCRASTQILADWNELEGFLRGEFRQRVLEEEDRQILFGDGSGNNLHGLTHQASSWDLTLLTASDGYEYIDILQGAQQQVGEADEVSDRQFFVLHPGDWAKIRRTKDTTGQYILGAPQAIVTPNIWGAPVVQTTQMTKGYFLLGSGEEQCAVIRERQGVAIDLSTEDGDNFRYNLVTVRVELRVVLIVKRPAAFIYGQLTQSPA